MMTQLIMCLVLRMAVAKIHITSKFRILFIYKPKLLYDNNIDSRGAISLRDTIFICIFLYYIFIILEREDLQPCFLISHNVLTLIVSYVTLGLSFTACSYMSKNNKHPK
jgi:hypothetical protein